MSDEAPRPPEQKRQGVLRTVAGAWTQAKRNGDAEIRQMSAGLLRFGIQAGVGALGMILVLGVLWQVLKWNHEINKSTVEAITENTKALAHLVDKIDNQNDMIIRLTPVTVQRRGPRALAPEGK